MTDTQTPADELEDPYPLPEPDPPPVERLPARTGAVGSVLGDLPVIPERNEMTAIAQLANTLAAANACPAALRGKPNDVFLVLLTARDLGVSLTTAMREFHVIEGKVTLSPKVKLAMVRQSGLGKIWPDPANDHSAATWHGERADMPGVVVSSTFNLADAKRAGLDGKQNWRNFPARMMSWRAAGYLLDDLFAEVGTGLYDVDSLGGVTNEDGEPIDVRGVEALPGLRGGKVADAPPAEALDAETLATLLVRLGRVEGNAGAGADLDAWWSERGMPAPADMTAAQARTLSAKLGAVEQAHGLVAEGPGGEAVERPQSDPNPDSAPTPPEHVAEPPRTPEDPIRGLLTRGPVDGDVAGWLIGVATGMRSAVLRAQFAGWGEPLPVGSVEDQRRAWCLRVHDSVAVATVRVLSGFGLDAADLEAVER